MVIGAAPLVTLRYAPDELQIEVRDDGDGCPTGDGLATASSLSRARQDQRPRDVGRSGNRGRLHPQHAPPPRKPRRAS
jgi:hypothetical protein